MADPVIEIEPLPKIEEKDYAQFREILKALPPTYAGWLEARKNMRDERERPYNQDYSQIEIHDVPISPDVFAKRCKDWGGCSSIEDLGRFTREEHAKMMVVRTTE